LAERLIHAQALEQTAQKCEQFFARLRAPFKPTPAADPVPHPAARAARSTHHTLAPVLATVPKTPNTFPSPSRSSNWTGLRRHPTFCLHLPKEDANDGRADDSTQKADRDLLRKQCSGRIVQCKGEQAAYQC
jgi:hypothetical protein